MANNNDILTLSELAEYLRVHPTTLYRLLKKGEIPSFKVGSDHRFQRAKIDEWMESQKSDGE